ncbi:hypothetical protein P280DRAFT_469065 [Massarina eburnea CBS 473.64]|uniref:Thioesterase/thiol ester dehydrase-isomerase n=1 Tax=Massarina eburnea CBS 473.64 TaxID=1395130 RepID=A0A6A6S0T8_9PLEO|nr:hypothetical protein P280DRAFT_469065 [Massarina eburnea CBS 473.64]
MTDRRRARPLARRWWGWSLGRSLTYVWCSGICDLGFHAFHGTCSHAVSRLQFFTLPVIMRPPARCALVAPRPFLSSARHVPLARYSSTSKDEPATASLSPRWLSDATARIGECIRFGLDTEQTKEAGAILQEMASNWRELSAGSEGFLAGKHQAGLFRHEVVWGEMDSMGHVNNVMYNRYAESARVNWILQFAAADAAHRDEWRELMTPKSRGLILRSIRTDYKFPLKYPDRVTVLHKLRSKPASGADHFILDVLIMSERHRRPAARCVEDIVVYDYPTARKSPMKAFMVTKLQEVFDLQEAAKHGNGNKVTKLIAAVRQLEKSSWDRPDAQEDMGGAANP